MSEQDDGVAAAGHAVAEPEGGRTGVEVVGSLGGARFPDLCAKCGGRADRKLPVSKIFYRSGDDYAYHFVASVKAPFCQACVRAHEREVRPIDPEVRRRLLRTWFFQALPYLFPLGVILFLLSVLGPDLLGSLGEGDMVGAGVWAAVCAFFGLLALMFLGIILRQGRGLMITPLGGTANYAQVERGPLGSRFTVPAAPTSVIRAVDFTDDRSEMFDRERHLFTFEHPEVGARFAELNADREWDPASTHAQLAASGRKLVFAVVVALVIWALVEEFF